MERHIITTYQIAKAKELKAYFREEPSDEGIKFIFFGEISVDSYCELLSLDFYTVRLLGEVTYKMEYNCIDGNTYILKCETYIDSVLNEKLSFELEDTKDSIGLYSADSASKARWLPGNWKELITDEQLHDILQERNIQTIECLQDNDVPDEMKERIAREWCKENSEELVDYLDENDKEDIAYDYIDNNPNEVADSAFSKLSDPKDFIKECIDNL